MATRFTNPFPRFFNDNAALLPSGTIDFFEPGSTVTRKATYTTFALSTANANPVVLSAGGVVPNIWLNGSYDIVMKDKDGNQIDQADNVGTLSSGVFDDWVTDTTYGSGGSNIVTGSDGLYYVSIQASNTANDPISTPTYWQEIRFVGTYNVNIAYAVGDVVRDSTGILYRGLTASNTGNTPSSSPTNWASLSDPSIVRSTRTSNTILDGSDVGQMIDVTSGTFSQTVTAAATLGSGWFVYYKNSGSGVVTIDPDGSETINGVATLTVNTGETYIVQCDGSNFNVMRISSGDAVNYTGRTSDTVLDADDRSDLIDVTGASTFTQTITAAATLGAGWYCYYKNSGTGDVTMDPNGSETIDGLTTFIMYPGESRLIQCDGSNFNSVVLSPFKKSFTASGTFTTPPGYQQFSGLLWSAGASGQKTGAETDARGGCGGGCGPFNLAASDFGATETITVGAGGAAQSGTSIGAPGGDSSIGSLFSVYAGNSYIEGGSVFHGLAVAAQAVGYEGCNSLTGNTDTIWGGANTNTGADAGDSIWGGAAGASTVGTGAYNPGTSIFAGNGGTAQEAGSGGGDGTQPAGGGGATETGTASGAGGDGQLDIWGEA